MFRVVVVKLPPTHVDDEVTVGAESQRRVPTQQRSRERVQRMIEAVDELLNEGGYEAVSTRAVAARAGVSVASLYQFFADKDALVRALSIRYLDRFQTIIPDLSSHTWSGWRPALRAALTAFAEFVAAAPGFRELWWGGHLDAAIVSADRVTNTVLARQLQAFVASDGQSTADLPLEPRIAYVIAVETADRLLELAHRAGPHDADAVLEEAMRIMTDVIERDLATTK